MSSEGEEKFLHSLILETRRLYFDGDVSQLEELKTKWDTESKRLGNVNAIALEGSIRCRIASAIFGREIVAVSDLLWFRDRVKRFGDILGEHPSALAFSVALTGAELSSPDAAPGERGVFLMTGLKTMDVALEKFPEDLDVLLCGRAFYSGVLREIPETILTTYLRLEPLTLQEKLKRVQATLQQLQERGVDYRSISLGGAESSTYG